MNRSISIKNNIIKPFSKLGRTLLFIGASFYIIVYLVIALTRLSYPFELECMEGGSVVHVQRLLEGQSLYVTPSLSFIPFIYPPLYYHVSSLFAHITGNGFLPLRLVSLLSSLGCFAFIFMIVHRRTSSFYASFIASCLFAATFHISGSWFDLARVDSLFLFLLLAGIYTFDSPRVLTRSIVSPMLLFLSFFTKQPALMVGVCLSAAVLFTHKRSERFWFPLSFILLMVGSFVVMNTLTAGWYEYYVFDLPTQHDIVNSRLVGFWTNDIAQYLAIALCVCVIPFLKIDVATNSKSDRIIKDASILGSLFIASYLSRIHFGGYDNVLMPVYAGIAIYFGIGLASSLKATRWDGKIKTVMILAIALQFAILFYSPEQQIPSPADMEQGKKLQQLISIFKGEVYLSDHPWYSRNLNKPSQAPDIAVTDILRAFGSGKWKQVLEQDMATAVAEKRYEAFIVDFKEFALRVPDFETHYELVASNICGSAFHPVTGWDRRPTYLYVRRTVQQNDPADVGLPCR